MQNHNINLLFNSNKKLTRDEKNEF
jgi:hypothetical protein